MPLFSTPPKRPILRRVLLVFVIIITVLAVLGLSLAKRYGTGEAYEPVSWDINGAPLASLQKSLDADLAANPDLNGGLMYILAPSRGIEGGAAAGFANVVQQRPMALDDALRIASITKTYVAATALVLAEQGLLDMDAPITDQIPQAIETLLSRNGFDTSTITMTHLLQHRAGLPDYASMPSFLFQLVTYDLTGNSTLWTPESQIALGVTKGEKLGAPGEAFHYSDTGYVIAGLIIEKATGKSLGLAVRNALDFTAMGTPHIWWERMEQTPAGINRAHQYFGKVDVTDIDPSLDLFGGGGMVATSRDLTYSMRAVVRGDLFNDPATSIAMQDAMGGPYGIGLFRFEIDEITCFGHGGFWGLMVLDCPTEDVTLTLSYTQSNVSNHNKRIGKIMRALFALSESDGA